VLRTVRRILVVVVLVVLVAACSDDDEESADRSAATNQPATESQPVTGNRFGCLDFVASVTSGPNAGRSWSGDLILTQDDTGAFTGVLVPPGAADRQTLEVRDDSGAICRAVGQRNNAQVSWFLYCQNNEPIFGTGQITPAGRDQQELRGIISGPTDRDFGVYHGRNYPPYIRIISPDFN